MAIHLIESADPIRAVEAVNAFEKTHNVFATQSHVTHNGSFPVYTFIVFYKEALGGK
jgi:hypothetical protein